MKRLIQLKISTAIAVFFLFFSSVIVASDSEIVTVSEPTFAITNVDVVDGTGGSVQRNQHVIIKDGIISAIVDASHESLKESSVTRIDGRGKTLIPGLVMMHEHMFYPVGRRNYTEMLYSFPRLYLAGGATTVRTAGTMAPYADLNLRDAIEQGTAIGPDIDVTAPYLNGPGLPIYKVKALSNATDAKRMVEYWSAEGVTSYKAYMHIRKDELKTIINLAHQRQQKVTAHLCSVTFREAAELGIDNLEHGFFVATDFVENKQENVCPGRTELLTSLAELDLESQQVSDLINVLVKNSVAITSTLTIFETYAKGRPKAPEAALAMLIPQVREQYEQVWQRIAEGDDQTWAIVFEKVRQLEKMFVEAGGVLLIGTDPTGYGGVIAGFANQRAVELMVESGFSVPDTIKMATLNGARYLERDREIGTIAQGKRADLVLINGDLISDVGAIHQIDTVFKAGIGYDSQRIRQSAENTVGLH